MNRQRSLIQRVYADLSWQSRQAWASGAHSAWADIQVVLRALECPLVANTPTLSETISFDFDRLFAHDEVG